MQDIRRINLLLGGRRAFYRAVFNLLEPGSDALILDVGTGAADVALQLLSHGQQSRETYPLRVMGLDIKPEHLRVARENRDLAPARVRTSCTLVAGDAFRLPLEDGSVDVVISTLFLHHFSHLELVGLFAELGRVARRGVVLNDITRAYVPLWFFRLARPVLARSYLTRHDGEASLRRAYTLQEMKQMAGECGGWQVESVFPYRMLVLLDKRAQNGAGVPE